MVVVCVKSPKSCASPSVAIVTKFTVFTDSLPFVIKHLTALLPPAPYFPVKSKSPKSAVLPSVDMVRYSIVLVSAGELYPRANNPRVGDEPPTGFLMATLISPKSTAFPVCAIVI